MISVVIPVRNGGATLRACLEAVFSCESPDEEFEVVVIDDASTDDTGEIAGKFPVTLVHMDRRVGPAVARNKGAEQATGDVLLFIDADMILSPGALRGVKDAFIDPEMMACQGVTESVPFNDGFVPSYRALRNAFYTEQMAKHDYHINFGTRCAAIRRSVFEELGGFDQSYTDASNEDEEFGRRVNRRYRVRVSRDIRGRHTEQGLFGCIHNYASRSYGAVQLAMKDDFTFDKSEVTPFHGIGAAAALAAPVVLVTHSGRGALPFIVVWGATRLGLWKYILRERGVIFLIGALPVDFILTASAGMGGMLGAVSSAPSMVLGKNDRGARR